MENLTREQVAIWMQQNPRDAVILVYQFMLGSSIGVLQQNGESKDEIRFVVESALAVDIESIPTPSVTQ